jgi:hypothetical protein
MADLWDNALVNPPFASNPPLKVNVPAKTYGLVLAILAVLGAVGSVIAMIGAFTVTTALGSECNSLNQLGINSNCNAVAGGTAIAGVGELVVLVGMIIGAWGGFQMYQGNHRGRALLAYALALGVVGNLVYLLLWGVGLYIAFFIVYLVIYALVYYFLVISRFPDEPPVVARAAMGPPSGYGQPPSYGGPPSYGPPPTQG